MAELPNEIRVELCVVIPAYNAEDTLGEQLRALAAQQVDFPWEVVVCDNGSTDNTLSVVRHWQARLPPLRLIDASARRGPAAARNVGVRYTTAPLIAFCDADDVVGQGWLTAMRAALQQDAFVAGGLEGHRLNANNRASSSWTLDVFRHDILPQLSATSTNNMGIKRVVFEEVGGFEEALRTGEDIDLCWRIQLAGHQLVHHPEIVLHVRKRDGLRAVFRQAYSYGTGDKQLRHRYAPVRAAFAERTKASTPQDFASPREAAGSQLTRKVKKVLRVRGRRDLVERTRRIGRGAGRRLGKVDRTIPKVEPPETLSK